MQVSISIIAAIGVNRELGRRGELLWRIPDDLKRFKALTMGHPVVMGRKTFESIGKPLPGRTNIVVTRNKGPSFAAQRTVLYADSLEEALAKARAAEGGEEIFVIGGAQIYEQALPYADRLYLTLIDASAADADALFPTYENIFTKKRSEKSGAFEGLNYRWVELEKPTSRPRP
jgi:dihydrofolate reductase